VWDFLAAKSIRCSITCNVNYLLNYDRMRDANGGGTNEVLRLAFEGPAQSFNYVSTTFVFGWAVRAFI